MTTIETISSSPLSNAWGTKGRKHTVRTWATCGVIDHGEFITAEICFDAAAAAGYSDVWIDEARRGARGHAVRVAVYDHLPVHFSVPRQTRYGYWRASLYTATDCAGRKHGYWLEATWVAAAEYSGTGEVRLFVDTKEEAESTLRHFARA